MNTGDRKNLHFSSEYLRQTVIGLAALLLMSLPLQGYSAEPRSLEELEKNYALEKDPRKRSRIALGILDQHLLKIRAFIATGAMMEETNSILSPYAAALERLGGTVQEAAHSGTSKNVEVGLRRHMRELEQIQISVSFRERALVDAVLKQVQKAREAVLYSIMNPSEKK